jgi:hypothetical protein
MRLSGSFDVGATLPSTLRQAHLLADLGRPCSRMNMEPQPPRDLYQYQKLNRGEIRLLKFSSLAEGDLSFEIQHKTLDQNTPSFAALSYTWGEAIFPHRLLVGKKYLPITANLRDGLVHIRRRLAWNSWHLKKSRLLWVDAVCINQADAREKSTQIALMSTLYLQASKVYVWLGMPESEPDIRAAASRLKHFYKRSLSSQKANVPLRPFWWPRKFPTANTFHLIRIFDPDDTRVFDVEGSNTHRAWRGIVEIWKNPFWNRAWILQESTVPDSQRTFFFGVLIWHVGTFRTRSKVVFLCGQYSTDWDAIAVSITVADHLQNMPLLNTTFMAGAQEPARKVLRLRIRREQPDDFDLLSLLQRFRHAECSNPRDKVYSLLGLVPDAFRAHIVPDYSKPVLEVYIDSISHTLIQPSPNLNFLGYAMKLDSPSRALSAEISHASWPSWVPNWDDPLPLHPFPKVLYLADKKFQRSLSMFSTEPPKRIAVGKVYNASLSSSPSTSISHHQLTVTGVKIDVLLDLISYQSMSPSERRAKLTEWKFSPRNKYAPSSTFDRALASLQVADVKYHVEGFAVARDNAANNALLEKPHAQLTPEEFRAKKAMRIALNHASSFRGLALTRRGYMAVVPWSARKGDRVCGLLGGQVLYVLRDVEGEGRGNSFEYIGECYTHGLMDGEVMRWVEAGDAVVERFTLV